MKISVQNLTVTPEEQLELPEGVLHAIAALGRNLSARNKADHATKSASEMFTFVQSLHRLGYGKDVRWRKRDQPGLDIGFIVLESVETWHPKKSKPGSVKGMDNDMDGGEESEY